MGSHPPPPVPNLSPPPPTTHRQSHINPIQRTDDIRSRRTKNRTTSPFRSVPLPVGRSPVRSPPNPSHPSFLPFRSRDTMRGKGEGGSKNHLFLFLPRSIHGRTFRGGEEDGRIRKVSLGSFFPDPMTLGSSTSLSRRAVGHTCIPCQGSFSHAGRCRFRKKKRRSTRDPGRRLHRTGIFRPVSFLNPIYLRNHPPT